MRQPTKNDLDRNLSTILHSAHHKAQAERARLTSEFAARGMASSTSLIGAVAGCLDKIHVEAIDHATQVIHEFIDRMNVAAPEIIGWARPHLQNLGNVVLGHLPSGGFPNEQLRVRTQYAIVFQQRLDGALRDLEIGFIKGRNVSPTGQPEELFSLKLGWRGLSIDLKELWRRVFGR
jgi:hypothetical protein